MYYPKTAVWQFKVIVTEKWLLCVLFIKNNTIQTKIMQNHQFFYGKIKPIIIKLAITNN